MLQQKFAALKAFRQFFPHGLFNHPWSGEANQRLGFSNIQIAEQGQTGGNAAGRGMGQHRNIGHAVFGQAGQHRAGFGHLHQ